MFDFINQSDRIALGTAQFGFDYGISNTSGKTSVDEVKRILNFCELNNIYSLDTAFAYFDSESALGLFDLHKFKIVSKFMSFKESNGLGIRNQLEQSLVNLRVENIYAYLAHRTLATTEAEWSSLLKLKDEGLVQKIGFSFNDLYEVDYIIKKGFIPDLVQAPFNYIDRRFSEKLTEFKDKFNTEIHTRSVFLQGLFFLDPNSLPAFFDPIKDLLLEIEHLDNKVGFLLQYVLDQPFIDKVVIGVNNKLQLENNLLALKSTKISNNRVIPSPPDECITPSKWPKI
jgi:aryl-alcohol dehydrogenase-like predicted oxidoreductase